MDDKNLTGRAGDLVIELRALFDSRWATKRTRDVAYRAADEIEVLRKRAELLEAEVMEWRYTVGPTEDAEMVFAALNERGITPFRPYRWYEWHGP